VQAVAPVPQAVHELVPEKNPTVVHPETQAEVVEAHY
jgi:hypothetical protein